MRHGENQRKRKRRFSSLALYLAVSLAVYSVGFCAMDAEASGPDTFWSAVEAYYHAESESFWPAHTGMEEAVQGYDDAKEGGEKELDGCREAVLESMTALADAFDETMARYEDVQTAYEVLTEEEKTAADEEDNSPQTELETIRTQIGGDGTSENAGLEAAFQEACLRFEQWNYWDTDMQYRYAQEDYYSAATDLWGDGENNITGSMQVYEAGKEAGKAGEELGILRESVLESIGALEGAISLAGDIYIALEGVYGNLSEAGKTEDITESYNEIVQSWLEAADSFQQMRLNSWKYQDCSDDYWNAEPIFWAAMDDFSGSGQEGDIGAYTIYMEALESGAEGLDVLYETVLGTRAAAGTGYELITEKIQAENAAYEVLTTAEQQEIYGEESLTPAETHRDIAQSYNEIEAAYKELSELEIPAPPQDIPEATPTPGPTAPPQDIPEATPTPGPTAPPQDIPEATPTPGPTAPPQDIPEATPTPGPTAPPQDIPEATPTPGPTVPPQDIPETTPTPAPTAPPQDVPEVTPAPTAPQGTTAASAPAQEVLADWNTVSKDIENSVASGEGENVYVRTGTEFQIVGGILDKLAGSRTALFANTGTGLSFSISGVDVPRGVPGLKVTMAAADGIPEAVKQSVAAGAVFSRAFAMEDKSVYPVKIDVHMNVGKENAGKNAYLYYYDETAAGLKLAGVFQTTEAGQAMFAISHGDEYIVVVGDHAAAPTGRYTVMRGDSLSGIAARNGISLKQLLKANPGIVNPNKIRPGDIINLDS